MVLVSPVAIFRQISQHQDGDKCTVCLKFLLTMLSNLYGQRPSVYFRSLEVVNFTLLQRITPKLLSFRLGRKKKYVIFIAKSYQLDSYVLSYRDRVERNHTHVTVIYCDVEKIREINNESMLHGGDDDSDGDSVSQKKCTSNIAGCQSPQLIRCSSDCQKRNWTSLFQG